MLAWYVFHPQYHTRAQRRQTLSLVLNNNREAGYQEASYHQERGSSHRSLVTGPAIPSLLPSLTLVAKQTSPALITGALPGDAAGAVTTAIVGDALVAQAALPTWTAARKQEGS